MEQAKIFQNMQSYCNQYLPLDYNYGRKKERQINPCDLKLYEITALTSTNQQVDYNAMENVLDALQTYHFLYVYIIRGTKEKIRYYLGVMKDDEEECENAKEQAEEALIALLANMEANYPQMKLECVSFEEQQIILCELEQANCTASIEGVPGTISSTVGSESIGIPRFSKVVTGEKFILMLLAKPLSCNMTEEISFRIQQANDVVASILTVNRTVQEVKLDEIAYTKQNNCSCTNTDSILKSQQLQLQLFQTNDKNRISLYEKDLQVIEDAFNEGDASNLAYYQLINDLVGYQQSPTIPLSKNQPTVNIGSPFPQGSPPKELNESGSRIYESEDYDGDGDLTTNELKNATDNLLENKVSILSINKSNTKSNTVTCTNGTNNVVTALTKNDKTKTCSRTQMITNLNAASWKDYLTDTVSSRYQYGLSRGLYVYTTFLFADTTYTLQKMAAAWRGMYTYNNVTKVPTRLIPLCERQECGINYFSYPKYQKVMDGDVCPISPCERIARIANSQAVCDRYLYGGYWASSRELRYYLSPPLEVI